MSVQLTPSKRSYDQGRKDRNGKGKKLKLSNYNSQYKVSPGDTVFRVLCPTSKIGSVIGKGGRRISQIRKETGAKVRVEDPLPGFDERVILILSSGKDSDVAAEGAKEIASEEIEEVETDEITTIEEDDKASDEETGGKASGDDDDEDNKPGTVEVLQPEKEKSSARRALLLVFEKMVEGELEKTRGDEENIKSMDFVIRLLVFTSQVGCILGKGGSIIKQMSSDSGAQIQVLPKNNVPPSASPRDEIVQHPDERICAPQDAVLRVQDRIFRAIPETQANTVPAKLPISSNLIGCLLGKGGSIIAEMRKSTGAYIRILGKDQLPNCALEDEEIIQINGEFDAVQDALMHITSRLRDHFFRHAFPSNTTFSDRVPPFPTYGGRRDDSPYRMHLNAAPPFPLRHEDFDPHDDCLPFMHRPGMPPRISERMQSAAWDPQDYAGVPQRRIGGFVGGIPHPIITNISVEVVVPRACVDAIYGEDGGCLKQIREFSEAKVSITDPKPGATEALIVISGTPEQTHAAQSLIQAFVMIESKAS